jgi:hypothetical protein
MRKAVGIIWKQLKIILRHCYSHYKEITLFIKKEAPINLEAANYKIMHPSITLGEWPSMKESNHKNPKIVNFNKYNRRPFNMQNTKFLYWNEPYTDWAWEATGVEEAMTFYTVNMNLIISFIIRKLAINVRNNWNWLKLSNETIRRA